MEDLMEKEDLKFLTCEQHLLPIHICDVVTINVKTLYFLDIYITSSGLKLNFRIQSPMANPRR